MQTFSNAAWQDNLDSYNAILAMPFNQELMQGTLGTPRFQHYMIQDAHYLEGFARALSLASAKGRHADDVVHFATAAQTAIVVERSLHADFFQKFGISQESFAETEPSPICEHYVSYLLRIAALEPIEVTLAVLLPCFWVYREVGKHIHARASAENPYQAWIDTYAGAEFEQAVDDVIQIVDDVAATSSVTTRQRMHHVFQRGVQLEWMFWEGAYQEQAWPIG